MESLVWNTSHFCFTSTTVASSQFYIRVRIRVRSARKLGGFGSRGRIQRCGAAQRACVVWQRPALGEIERLERKRTCECHDQHDVQVPYVEAWRWQKLRVQERVAMLGRGEDFDDTLIILQHPPVYTLGTRSSEANLKFDVDDSSFELHRTERGGEVGIQGSFKKIISMKSRINRISLGF